MFIVQIAMYHYDMYVKVAYDTSVLGCVTHCSQSAEHSCEQFLQVQWIGFVTLGHLRCA